METLDLWKQDGTPVRLQWETRDCFPLEIPAALVCRRLDTGEELTPESAGTLWLRLHVTDDLPWQAAVIQVFGYTLEAQYGLAPPLPLPRLPLELPVARGTLPEILSSVAWQVPSGYREKVPLRRYSAIRLSGVTLGQSLHMGISGGIQPGAFKGVWRDGTTPQHWDTQLPVTQDAQPGTTICTRLSDATVLYFLMDLHRLPDMRYLGHLRVVNSDGASVDGTLELPATATHITMGSFGGEVGEVDIAAIAYQ